MTKTHDKIKKTREELQEVQSQMRDSHGNERDRLFGASRLLNIRLARLHEKLKRGK